MERTGRIVSIVLGLLIAGGSLLLLIVIPALTISQGFRFELTQLLWLWPLWLAALVGVCMVLYGARKRDEDTRT